MRVDDSRFIFSSWEVDQTSNHALNLLVLNPFDLIYKLEETIKRFDRTAVTSTKTGLSSGFLFFDLLETSLLPRNRVTVFSLVINLIPCQKREKSLPFCILSRTYAKVKKNLAGHSDNRILYVPADGPGTAADTGKIHAGNGFPAIASRWI